MVMKIKTKNLVCQYLENVSRKVLEDHGDIIRKYVRNRHGVYALYNRRKLYYVGLASNLRSRLKHHLKDRHAATWDYFSIYLTVGDHHLRELEALLLRIAMPDGNKQKGKFGYAQDLTKLFRKDVKAYQNNELTQMFYSHHPSQVSKVERNADTSKAILARYINRRFHIRFRYRGKLYIAHVRKNGTIVFASESASGPKMRKHVFYSPSEATKAITKHGINGWLAWTYERAPGDWVPLDELRK